MTAMRTRQGGFTLIELMITIAILGILASIAIPAFMQYMRKSKTTEADLALDHMAKKARIYHLAKGVFPPQSGVLPTVSACLSGTGKTTALPQSTWEADPGFGALEFHQDEPGYFRYIWFNFGTLGVAYSFGDLDCDGITGSKYRFLSASGGNITTTYFDFMSGD
jgi:prepilin-type N-terminal cleavage/methylation domain-containing protein